MNNVGRPQNVTRISGLIRSFTCCTLSKGFIRTLEFPFPKLCLARYSDYRIAEVRLLPRCRFLLPNLFTSQKPISDSRRHSARLVETSPSTTPLSCGLSPKGSNDPERQSSYSSRISSKLWARPYTCRLQLLRSLLRRRSNHDCCHGTNEDQRSRLAPQRLS